MTNRIHKHLTELADKIADRRLGDDTIAQDVYETEQAIIPGGFDGMLLTIGEGADDDTWNGMFSAWCVRLALRDGTEVTAFQPVAAWDDSNRLVLTYFTWDEVNDTESDEKATVRMEDVVGVHIF